MKKFTIEITEDESKYLNIIANDYETTEKELLTAFIADLTGSNRTGGSDERIYANDWLQRNIFDGKFLR